MFLLLLTILDQSLNGQFLRWLRRRSQHCRNNLATSWETSAFVVTCVSSVAMFPRSGSRVLRDIFSFQNIDCSWLQKSGLCLHIWVSICFYPFLSISVSRTQGRGFWDWELHHGKSTVRRLKLTRSSSNTDWMRRSMFCERLENWDGYYKQIDWRNIVCICIHITSLPHEVVAEVSNHNEPIGRGSEIQVVRKSIDFRFNCFGLQLISWLTDWPTI